MPGIVRYEQLVMWIILNCWQGQHPPLFPQRDPFYAQHSCSPGGWRGRRQWERGQCVHFHHINTATNASSNRVPRENSLHLALGFYHVGFFLLCVCFPKNWIRPCVELWMPIHLLHNRTAEQSVFKGQSCSYPPFLPTSSAGFSLFIPVRIFFFFSHHFESAACR